MLFASCQIRYMPNINKDFTKTSFQGIYFIFIFPTTYLSHILLIITTKQIPESLHQTSRDHFIYLLSRCDYALLTPLSIGTKLHSSNLSTEKCVSSIRLTRCILLTPDASSTGTIITPPTLSCAISLGGS